MTLAFLDQSNLCVTSSSKENDQFDNREDGINSSTGVTISGINPYVIGEVPRDLFTPPPLNHNYPVDNRQEELKNVTKTKFDYVEEDDDYSEEHLNTISKTNEMPPKSNKLPKKKKTNTQEKSPVRSDSFSVAQNLLASPSTLTENIENGSIYMASLLIERNLSEGRTTTTTTTNEKHLENNLTHA